MLFDKPDNVYVNLQNLIKNIKNLDIKHLQTLEEIANANQERIVFLGSNHLLGIAQEASLKTLELSNGAVNTYFNSALGFRHGPKAVINNKTIVFILLSSDDYTRKYDIDLAKEIFNEHLCNKLIIMDYRRNSKLTSICDKYIYSPSSRKTLDIYAGLFYIYLMQVFALYKSVKLLKTPDNPCPSGQVNRVVQGVKIHRLK